MKRISLYNWIIYFHNVYFCRTRPPELTDLQDSPTLSVNNLFLNSKFDSVSYTLMDIIIGISCHSKYSSNTTNISMNKNIVGRCKMPSFRKYFLCYMIILARLVSFSTSSHTLSLKVVSRQLQCDVIKSYQTSSFTRCAVKCLEKMNSCEGISLDQKSICNLCLVKAVTKPMIRFTMPSEDHKIYIRVMNPLQGIFIVTDKSIMKTCNTPWPPFIWKYREQ